MELRSSRWVAVVLAAVGLAGCGGGSGYSGGSTYAGGASPKSAPASDWGGEGDASDAPPAPMAQSEAGSTRISGAFERAPQPSRPGLGTQWGETRHSAITSAPFVRADSKSPFASAAIFYNDAQGADAMASMSGFRRFTQGSVDVGGGIATVRLKNGRGGFLSGFEAGGKRFMMGAAGDRYSIVIDNNAPARLEVVVSVDGLDVLDGKEAGFGKRGYLIDPHGSIEIDGFRQSMDAVAAFRFGAVKNSYAEQKHGESRNVGVIGVALFNEQGTSPAGWMLGDTQQRLNADPFPGKFATPP